MLIGPHYATYQPTTNSCLPLRTSSILTEYALSGSCNAGLPANIWKEEERKVL